MTRFYLAADLQHAHIVLGLLTQAGIEAKVFNENAQGAIGEIPFVHPEIWLVDPGDVPTAREIVRTFESTPANSGVAFCRGCGEESPANFQICWKCGDPI